LFVPGFGAAGYATRRGLSGLARTFVWALVALIAVGIVLNFVQIPGGALIYAITGLVIFARILAYDFQRLRRENDLRTAPLLAASILLNLLNVSSCSSRCSTTTTDASAVASSGSAEADGSPCTPKVGTRWVTPTARTRRACAEVRLAAHAVRGHPSQL
jgi:hypothetical protein